MAELRSRLTETEIRISQNLPSYDDSRVMTSSVMMSSMTSSSTASESRSLCSDAEADQFCQKVQIRNNQVEKILKWQPKRLKGHLKVTQRSHDWWLDIQSHVRYKAPSILYYIDLDTISNITGPILEIDSRVPLVVKIAAYSGIIVLRNHKRIHTVFFNSINLITYLFSPCKMISPHSAAYVSEMRKVSSESDSIVGFGEEGNATRHYTEVRFQFDYWSLLRKFIVKTNSDYDQFWEFAPK